MTHVHNDCTHEVVAEGPSDGDSRTVSPKPALQRGLLRAIYWYQKAREGRPSPCRFWPSCSEYAMEAISVHGSGRGTWLAIRRLSRCRPFGPSGVDPVPAPKGRA